MSAPYAFKYIDKDNIVRDFTKIDDFVERVKNMDAKIEDLTKQISESNCSCDQERINNIDNRLQNVEELIGEDEGENDTNLNDVMSKLATHSSNINGMKLDISSNKTTLNSVNNKVTTNTTDIAELKKQIAQLNANITAIMTSLNNKLDKQLENTITFDWKDKNGIPYEEDHLETNDVVTILERVASDITYISKEVDWVQTDGKMEHFNTIPNLKNRCDAIVTIVNKEHNAGLPMYESVDA